MKTQRAVLRQLREVVDLAGELIRTFPASRATWPTRRGEPISGAGGGGQPSDPTGRTVEEQLEQHHIAGELIEYARESLSRAADRLNPRPATPEQIARVKNPPDRMCANIVCWKPALPGNPRCGACRKYLQRHPGRERPAALVEQERERDVYGRSA